VALASVTGAELRDVLREMAAPDVDFGKDDWWHGHVSNARVVWDADGERLGGHCRRRRADRPRGTLHRRRLGVPAPLRPRVPDARAQRHRVDEADIQYEVLADYAREHGIDPGSKAGSRSRIEKR